MLLDDPGAPRQAASLSEQLLLEALNRLGVIEQRVMRTETQNEAIIGAQVRAEQRHNASDESRGRMHSRINEIAVNVASLETEVTDLRALQPIVTMLKDAHIERSVIRKVLTAICKNGYARAGGAAVAGAAVAGGALLHQWESLVGALRRLFGFKVGGP